MKAGTRSAIILSGLGACALAGGVALGRFTVAGLDTIERPMDEIAQLQAFLNDEAARQAATRKRPDQPVPPPTSPGANHHVCEGCDAQLFKDPQLAQLAAGGAGRSDLAPDAYAQPAD